MEARKKQVASQSCIGAAPGEAPTSPPQFDKEQIAASARYNSQRDLVEALLEDGKRYSIGAVDALIEHYKKGKVK